MRREVAQGPNCQVREVRLEWLLPSAQPSQHARHLASRRDTSSEQQAAFLTAIQPRASQTSPTHQPVEEDGEVEHELVVLHVEIVEDLAWVENHKQQTHTSEEHALGYGAETANLRLEWRVTPTTEWPPICRCWQYIREETWGL